MEMAETEAIKYMKELFAKMREFVLNDPYSHGSLSFFVGLLFAIVGFLNMMFDILQLFPVHAALDCIVFLSGGCIAILEFNDRLLPGFIRIFFIDEFSMLYHAYGRTYWILFIRSVVLYYYLPSLLFLLLIPFSLLLLFASYEVFYVALWAARYGQVTQVFRLFCTS